MKSVCNTLTTTLIVVLIGLFVLNSFTDTQSKRIQKPKVLKVGKKIEVVPEVVLYSVYATREGLIGGTTASGLIIQKDSIFVALPHRNVLGKIVEVRYGEKTIKCKVKDVGPWSTKDDYWKKDKRPLSESGLRVPESYGKKWGKPKNGAGIDLSDGLWDALGIPRKVGITRVQWRFSGK